MLLFTFGHSFVNAGAVATAQAALVALVSLFGLIAALVGASDWATAVEVTGPIIRLGTSMRTTIRATTWQSTTASDRPSARYGVSKEQYAGPRQGQVVTVRATSRLGRVRWIACESEESRLGAA